MDRIFIADGPVWTSAGMTAGIDLALGLIERDLGEDIARATARTLVVHHRKLTKSLFIADNSPVENLTRTRASPGSPAPAP